MAVLSGCGGTTVKLQAEHPKTKSFDEVAVHDPAIVRDDDGTYYVFGSHLAVASSEDLMNWKMVSTGLLPNGKIIPNIQKELKDVFEWSHAYDLWAPEVMKLKDGKYHMYYCSCEGSSPVSALGMATSDSIDGPYQNQGILLRSGQGAEEADEGGDLYQATKDPNCIDPNLFYDKDGRLWMVYGSYSGGIFVKEVDANTGLFVEGGYGKKLLGGNHLRIEGPYILYNAENDYYYLFLSFGELSAQGGYNIRVARSKNPDGPYYDSMGQDMIKCKGAYGTSFDNAKAEQYGTKLMGAYKFLWTEGESGEDRNGYLSMGHNSCFYDEESGKYFIVYHQRFENRGEEFEVRVHQMFFNEDGWPVIAPYRYTGETIGHYTKEEVAGSYKYINHGREITSKMAESVRIELQKDGKITGENIEGSWEMVDGNRIHLQINDMSYQGVVCIMYDDDGDKDVMTFTACNQESGTSIWGSSLSALE